MDLIIAAIAHVPPRAVDEQAPRLHYTNYELKRGSLAGLSFGGGIVYKKLPTYASFFGDVQGKPLPNLNAGDIVEVDASIGYQINRWKIGLQASNLFNTKYYTPSYPSPFYASNVNAGRQVIARIGYSF
jgi:outer membrane receptor protein involved in Fe transport